MEASVGPILASGAVAPIAKARLRLASDSHLVALIRDGRSSAFEAMYDRHHRAILSFCRHMLGDREEAEDAVQHTFMAAYNQLVGSEKPIQLRAWLFTIARNRCYSILRVRREPANAEHLEPASEGLAIQVQRRQDLRDLVLDMQRLPADQRAALVLAELDSLSHKEVGEVLGVPTEKVKALVFQARESLIASRSARETDCSLIRAELSTLTGGGLRRSHLRRHLRQCAGCREFRKSVERQRRQLAVLLPVAPTLALKNAVIAGAGSTGGASAIGSGGLLASSALKGGLVKLVASAAIASIGTAGTIVATHEIANLSSKLLSRSQHRPSPPHALRSRVAVRVASASGAAGVSTIASVSSPGTAAAGLGSAGRIVRVSAVVHRHRSSPRSHRVTVVLAPTSRPSDPILGSGRPAVAPPAAPPPTVAPPTVAPPAGAPPTVAPAAVAPPAVHLAAVAPPAVHLPAVHLPSAAAGAPASAGGGARGADGDFGGGPGGHAGGPDGRAGGSDGHAGGSDGHAGGPGGHAGSSGERAGGSDGHAGSSGGHAGSSGEHAGGSDEHVGGPGGHAGGSGGERAGGHGGAGSLGHQGGGHGSAGPAAGSGHVSRLGVGAGSAGRSASGGSGHGVGPRRLAQGGARSGIALGGPGHVGAGSGIGWAAPISARAPAPISARTPAPIPARAPAPIPARAPAPIPARAPAPIPPRVPAPILATPAASQKTSV